MSILKVSIRQIKAARSLLAWSQDDLANASGVSIPTVKRLEASDGDLGGRAQTGQKMVDALEAAGVEFIPENGGGAGVRLRKPGAADAKPFAADVIARGADFRNWAEGTAEAARSAQRVAEDRSSAKPAGPATDAIDLMEAEIAADRGKGQRSDGG